MADHGPVGGTGGRPFDEVAPAGTEIGALIIRSGRFIDAIQVLWRNASTGELILGDKHGGNGGTQTIIPLNAGEFFIEISGRTGRFVDSLSLQTNQGRRFGRFGGLGGSSDYEFPPTLGEEIFGFFGRSGRLIDAIGIHTRPR